MPNNLTHNSSFNIKLIHALLLTAKHQGISLEKALANSEINADTLDLPGQRYPTATFEALLMHLTDSSQNPNLITQAAEITQPRMLGSIGFVMTTAATLLDAYQMLADYFSLIYEGIKLSISFEQHNCILTLDIDHNISLVNEFFIVCLLHWPRWLIGRTIPAQSIHYNFSKSSTKNHQQQLTNNVIFDQPQSQIVFKNQYMSLSCSEANAEMHQLHCNFADSLLLKSSQKQALIAQTKTQIRKRILEAKAGEQSAIRREEIAQSLNMSLRTFQRKLNILQSNYQLIYDSVRQEICLQLINQVDLNLSQIADKLGFSNLSSFQKAFKRWMKVSPSEYKKQFTSNHFLTNTVVKTKPKSQWYLALSTEQLHEQVAEKLASLSDLSVQLLTLSALVQNNTGKAMTIEQLVKITGNSIARLNIYLWPATQQSIINNIENLEASNASISFYSEQLIKPIAQLPSKETLSEHHYNIARYYQHNSNQLLAFKHYQLCTVDSLRSSEQLIVLDYCKQTITHTSRVSSRFLNDVYDLFIRCAHASKIDNRSVITLYIDQLAVWVDLNLFDKAQRRIDFLHTQHLSFNQRISLAIIASQLLVELNQTEQALELLTHTADKYCGIADATNLKSNVLIDISQQLEVVSNRHSNQPQFFEQPLIEHQQNNSIKNPLRLLHKITNICLQANLPMRAAGAIARMFSLCLEHCDNFYAPFACAHFSWLCSWFSADIKAANACAKRSLYLAEQHSESHLQNCKLILATKLNHWLIPLNQSIGELKIEATFYNHLTDKKAFERHALLQQLSLCQGENLKGIQDNCKDFLIKQTVITDSPSMSCINNILKSVTNILVTDKHKVVPTPKYNNCVSAFTQLFSACYTFQYDHWNIMHNWDARIESDISSHYIATEAVFICTLMRIHNLTPTTKKPVKSTHIEGHINRLRMWSKLRPENYAAQYAIIKAIYFAKFNTIEHSMLEFEKIFADVEKYGALPHQILYYHYYAELVKHDHPVLSALCQEKEQHKKRYWCS
jgi:AraC-like DNA-binding protein